MTTTQNQSTQAATTPDDALKHLIEGNRRFVENRREDRNLLEQVEATRGGQWPFAVVLGCIDSRVPVEMVFDAGIGDLFSARVAGNFVNEDVLGSMEFACKVAGAKLVVVLGHTHCGAIKGACDDVKLGNLTAMLAKLRPAVERVTEPADPEQRTSSNVEFVRAVTHENVLATAAAVREQSDVLRELEAEGQIRIVGAIYDVESGSVEWVD